VETDKATVTFDATEEGYLAKILVGAGEIKVLVVNTFDMHSKSIKNLIKLNFCCHYGLNNALLQILTNFYSIFEE